MSKSMVPDHIRSVLVTGGAGFIGGAVVRRLLRESQATIYNLDKMGYASDLVSINQTMSEIGADHADRHQLLKVDLVNAAEVEEAVERANPDLVMHLAAESHVDRSIEGPSAFVESNIIGTFNLLQAVRNRWEKLQSPRKDSFRFHHISTDEVFGSLGPNGRFSETTPYDPRSPYSASKASSDHLVSAWFHTYGLPVVLTNCSNNYGPWQYPEKLIPVVINKCLKKQTIPVYGDGMNIRDWLHVEDHVSALLLAALFGTLGQSYCVGGYGERSNMDVVKAICRQVDELMPNDLPNESLITSVKDRLGHDRRYAIDPTKIETELGWSPEYTFEDGIKSTIEWYIGNQDWINSK
jgi:dTDP-glucose 4,6-dehydratase